MKTLLAIFVQLIWMNAYSNDNGGIHSEDFVAPFVTPNKPEVVNTNQNVRVPDSVYNNWLISKDEFLEMVKNDPQIGSDFKAIRTRIQTLDSRELVLNQNLANVTSENYREFFRLDQLEAEAATIDELYEQQVRATIDLWADIGMNLSNIQKFDSARYYLAYLKTMNQRGINPNNPQVINDILASFVHFYEIRNNYNFYPASWMGDHNTMLPPVESNRASIFAINRHLWIDSYNNPTNYVLDELSSVSNQMLDDSLKLLVATLSQRRSSDMRHIYYQIFIAARTQVKYQLYSELKDRYTLLIQSIISRYTNINSVCSAYLLENKNQFRFQPNSLITAEDPPFTSSPLGELNGSEYFKKNLGFFNSYYTSGLQKIRKLGDGNYEFYDEMKNVRLAAEVLACETNFNKFYIEVLKEINSKLLKSIGNKKQDSCFDNNAQIRAEVLSSEDAFRVESIDNDSEDVNIILAQIEERDADYFSKKADLEQFLGRLPSIRYTNTGNSHYKDSEIEREESTLAVSFLDKVGKDLIDQAVNNIVVMNHVYDLNFDFESPLQFYCSDANNSEFCATFKEYIEERLTATNQSFVANNQSLNKIQNCGGEDYLTILSSVIFEESRMNEGFDPSKYIQRGGQGTARLNQAGYLHLTNKKYDLIKSALGTDLQLMFPYMITDEFLTSVRPSTIGRGRTRPPSYRHLLVNCSEVKNELRDKLIKNLAYIANPNSLLSNMDFMAEFANALPESVYRFRRAVSSAGSVIANNWRELSTNNPEEILSSMLNMSVQYGIIGFASDFTARSDYVSQEVEEQFLPLKALREQPEAYVNHVITLIRTQNTQDSFYKQRMKSYLHQFNGINKFVCSVYSMAHGPHGRLVDGLIKDQIEFFKKITIATTFILGIASIAIPPLAGFATAVATATTFANNTLDIGMADINASMAVYNESEEMSLCAAGLVADDNEITNEESAREVCLSALETKRKTLEVKATLDNAEISAIVDTSLLAVGFVRSGIANNRSTLRAVRRFSDSPLKRKIAETILQADSAASYANLINGGVSTFLFQKFLGRRLARYIIVDQSRRFATLRNKKIRNILLGFIGDAVDGFETTIRTQRQVLLDAVNNRDTNPQGILDTLYNSFIVNSSLGQKVSGLVGNVEGVDEVISQLADPEVQEMAFLIKRSVNHAFILKMEELGADLEGADAIIWVDIMETAYEELFFVYQNSHSRTIRGSDVQVNFSEEQITEVLNRVIAEKLDIPTEHLARLNLE